MEQIHEFVIEKMDIQLAWIFKQFSIITRLLKLPFFVFGQFWSISKHSPDLRINLRQILEEIQTNN